MERLTEYRENGKYIAIKRRKTLYPIEERWNAPATAAIVRLCHYEDSGLTPEEVMELAKIVKCKDCKHYVPLKGSEENKIFWHGICRNWRTDDEHIPYTDENGFCKNGEKRLEA